MINRAIRLLSALLFCLLLLSACGNDAKVVGYTSRGTPIVAVDVGGIAWLETDYSECFSEIGYDEDTGTLYVRFRDSGAAYRYLEFPEAEWNAFNQDEDPGVWYNYYIKGHYECQKIY